jgi:histidine triad (HIT) family protein
VTECVFCEIAAGRVIAPVVLEAPAVIAFLDHRPLFPGHVLLIPRSHVATIDELPDDLAIPVIDATRRLAAAMCAGLGAEGTLIAMNNVVSQSVPHLHLHIVPRRRGDGLRGFFWPRSRYESPEEAERIRMAIVAAL